jgi:hypothetical protein
MSLPPLPPSDRYDTAQCSDCYSSDKLREYGQQCRAEALEEAAKFIIEPIGHDNYTALRQAAEKIRRLK